MTNKKQMKTIEPPKPNLNIEGLIAQGIDKGLSVETMERLLAMRTQLKAEFAKEQFVKSLAAFQAECPTVEKRKKVSFGTTNYSYAPLEVIVEQVKHLLSKNGFSYMFDTQTNGKMKVICKVYHLAGHMEPATFDMEIDNNAKMNVSQKYGSALTYAKRYAFCAAFGINVKDEDIDTIVTSPVALEQLSPAFVSMINKTDTLDALVGACRVIKTKIKPELQKTLIQEYSRRKEEIEAIDLNKPDPMVDERDAALNKK